MCILDANGDDGEILAKSLTLPPTLGDPPADKSEGAFPLHLALSLTPPETNIFSQFSLPVGGFALRPAPGVARTMALVKDETFRRFRVS